MSSEQNAVIASTEPAPAPLAPALPVQNEMIPASELAELRRRADKYRFLYRTIVAVTGILVVAMTIIVLVAMFTDT